MKTFIDFLTESLSDWNFKTELAFTPTGKKRAKKYRFENLSVIEEDKDILTRNNQMIFKHYIHHMWNVDKNYPEYVDVADYYYNDEWMDKKLAKKHVPFMFDDVDCIDISTFGKQPVIPGVKCDGTMTFLEARLALEKYFKVKNARKSIK